MTEIAKDYQHLFVGTKKNNIFAWCEISDFFNGPNFFFIRTEQNTSLFWHLEYIAQGHGVFLLDWHE